MTTRIKLRRDTAANWAANNPVLALGEPGLDLDRNQVKYGDGVTAWNALGYSGQDATENIWLAVGSDCNQGHVKVSRDGVKWTESFAPMPRYSEYNWQNFWWAKPMGGKVIYDMYVDYLGDETLGVSDNALDYPLPVTFTNEPTTDGIDSKDWWDAYYLNGKFIAVGGYFKIGSDTVERPMFAYSDDGVTWTHGAIDDDFTSDLVNDADGAPTGIRISSVAWNGTGYLFALDWDYNFGGGSSLIPPGFFYVTSLTSELNSTKHINPDIGHNSGLKGLVWNHDHWAAYGHQNVWDRASLFVNTNLDPRTGSWVETQLNNTDANGPQKQAFGSYPEYGSTLEAFTTGKIGDYYWDVMGLANGRVMATKDKGLTWIGSVPFNLFSSIDSINYTNGNTEITFNVPSVDGGTYSPQEGERIDIRYGNVEQLQGVFWLGTEVGSDGDSRTWTIFANRALTTPVNSSAWFEDYDTNGNNGYALVTFSRDSDGDDPLTYGGFDQLKIADGKIVAINGAAWACSTDLLNWTLSVNLDVYTSQSYGTSGLEWGAAGSTNGSSLTYVSDTHLATEAVKEEIFEGPDIPADLLWFTQSLGNYVNQLALAENFKVSLGGGQGFFNAGPAISMGMEPQGKWWIGYDNRTVSESGLGNYTPPSIGCEDWLAPGYEDVVIRTDTADSGYTWVFTREGAIEFPGKTTVDYDNRTDYTSGPTLQLAQGGGDSSVIITGPAATTSDQAAKRLVIQGQPGWRGTATQATGAEGGDVYIWAGYGGEGSENTGPGGDVKLKGGKGGLEGGYVRLEAGNATALNGAGGFVDITAGDATSGAGGYETAYGGSVNITAGQGYGAGGSVNINAGEGNVGLDGSVNINTLGGDHTWEFKPDGTLVFPNSTTQSTAFGIAAFGEGFSLTATDKVVTNKLYSTNESEPTQHYRLELDTNGVVVLPDQSIINGSTIRGVYGTGELNYTGITIGPDANHREESWMYVDANGAYIATKYNTAQKLWTFDNNGRTTFPAATVPAHSYGAAGDKAGMIAFDSTYIYYCTADYVNTSTDIWKRVELDATAW